MKILHIAIILLLATTLLTGCAQEKTADTGMPQDTTEVSEEEALSSADSGLIGETSEVEIGEMI